MRADNWIESISSDCYGFWHCSKTMDRVNYRMVEEDSWDFDCLTIGMKHNHLQIAFYRCFPMCHRGPSQCVSGNRRKRYRIALDSAHSGGNTSSLQGVTGKWKVVACGKWKVMLAWNCQNKETHFEACNFVQYFAQLRLEMCLATENAKSKHREKEKRGDSVVKY